MKKTVTLLAGILTLALAAGCGSTKEKEEVVLPPPAKILTSGDVNQVHKLKKGEFAQISLKENPTTGYSWFFHVTSGGLEGKPLGEDGPIKVAGERFTLPDTELVGAPGMKEVMIEGARPGRATLIGECRRPWEKNVEPVMTIRYEFDVTP